MGREIIMVGICTLAVIVLTWMVDHPDKEKGTLIALGAFAVMVLVAYLKNRNRVDRRPSRLIVKEKSERLVDTGVNEKTHSENDNKNQ